MVQPLMSTGPTRRRLIVTLLVTYALATYNVLPVLQAQTPQKSDAASKQAEETKRIKERILKIGPRNDVTIVRRDGREFYGRIESIGEDSVSIYEVDLKVKVEISFDQIKSVSKGYGSTRAWNGKRIPSKKRLIGLIIGIGVLILPVILIANGKD